MKELKIEICISVIIIVTILLMFGHFQHKATLYKEIQQAIQDGNWISAKNNLSELGHYKNSESLSKTVNYNYYLKIGDEKQSKREYKLALDFYNNAKQYNNSDLISQKISNVEKIIKKQEDEEKKKKAEEERKKKQEQERLQQIKNKELKKKLAEIEPTIKRTFYKVNIIEDKELKAVLCDFYIDPYTWETLPYDVRENAFKLAVVYAKLKTNEKYTNDEYMFATKIRNANTKAVLAEYTPFNGIKIK